MNEYKSTVTINYRLYICSQRILTGDIISCFILYATNTKPNEMTTMTGYVPGSFNQLKKSKYHDVGQYLNTDLK